MDLTLYQKMIGVSNNSISKAYINDTIVHVNDMFGKSPNCKTFIVDSTEIDVIVSHTKKSTELDLLFRPQTAINKGIFASTGLDNYLITEFVPNEIYPKAKAELCNNVLKWKDDEGNVISYPCVVKASSFSETDDRQAQISQAELVVISQYNDSTKLIKPNQRFLFGENSYEVTTIDSVTNVYQGEGLIEFIVRFASTTTTDDKQNQIADTSGNSGWGDWS